MTQTPESYRSGGEDVPVGTFLPQGSGRVPGVLIIHGSSGLGAQYRADIESFGEALAEQGIGAMLPQYFAAAKMRPDADGLPLIETHFDTWKTACRDGLIFMAGHRQIDPARLGVIGFSLGAHYALGLAMDPPPRVPVKCVVDFFGPIVARPLPGRLADMPPLLIHHGSDDKTVFPAESKYLLGELTKAGKKEGTDVQLEEYPGEGHGFGKAALAKARTATVEFIARTL